MKSHSGVEDAGQQGRERERWWRRNKQGTTARESELELAEKTRQYLLPLDLCRIGIILVRGVVKWRGCALLLLTSEWHNRGDEDEGEEMSSGDGAPGDGKHGAILNFCRRKINIDIRNGPFLFG